jgi:hypothetical protein
MVGKEEGKRNRVDARRVYFFFRLVGFVRDNVVLSCALLARCLRRFPQKEVRSVGGVCAMLPREYASGGKILA